MATVPTVDNFRQSPSGGERGVATPSADFSGSQQIINRGRQTLADANAMFERERERADAVRVLEAENEARREAQRLTYDREEGYTNIKGGSVLDRPSGKPLADEYDEKFNSVLGSIAAKLTGPRQRAAFEQRAAEMRTQFRGNAMQYEAAEYTQHQKSVFKGAADLSAEAIAKAGANPEAIDEELSLRLRPAVAELGRLDGLSANEVEALTLRAESEAVGNAILGAVERGDTQTAALLFERYEHKLNENKRTKIEAVMRREIEANTVMDVADAAFGDVLSVEEYNLPVVGGRVTSRFGESRSNGGTHNGVDIAVPEGTAVRAPAQGVVERVWEDDANGKAVRIRFADGTVGGFAHLSEVHVKAGDKISMGQGFAASGNTGRSTGPHLHYTLERDGKKTDPLSPNVSATKPATLGDAIDRAESMLPSDAPASLRQAVRSEVKQRWQVQEYDRKAREDELVKQAYAAMIQNGGNVMALPPKLRAALPPDRYADVVSFSNAVRNANDQTDVAAYEALVSNPRRLAQMSDAEFMEYAPKLSRGDFSALAASRATLRGEKPDGKAGVLPMNTINDVVDNRLASFGIDVTNKASDTEKTQRGAARRAINNAVLAEQARIGRQLTAAEVTALADKMLSSPRTVEGWFSTGQEPLGTVRIKDIPDAAREQIKRAYADRGLVATDEDVIATYIQIEGR